MSGRNEVVFKFKRGDDYSCYVTITNGDTVVFSNISYPKDTPEDVVEKMLDDAERLALKHYMEDKASVYSHYD